MPAPKKRSSRAPLAIAAFIVIIFGGGIGALAYLAASSKSVYIDTATIQAPVVNLSPTQSGILEQVYVAEGDVVPANTVVAKVGTQLLKTTAAGLITTVNNNIGATIDPGTVVVAMVDPNQMRVVGQLQEDKGLSDIRVGERASFTVDAFGGQQFEGIVDAVAPSAKSQDVVFNVSDTRAEQNFNIKVRFNQTAYPQLKNGMSARIWIYKQ
jgi:multidrug resistance efflux pump